MKTAEDAKAAADREAAKAELKVAVLRNLGAEGVLAMVNADGNATEAEKAQAQANVTAAESALETARTEYYEALEHRDALQAQLDELLLDEDADEYDVEDLSTQLHRAQETADAKADALYEATVTLKGTAGIEAEAEITAADAKADAEALQAEAEAMDDRMTRARNTGMAAGTLGGSLKTLRTDEEARALNVDILEATGEVSVDNGGDITVTVETGDLNVNAIRSETGSVTLTSMEGSILAVDTPSDLQNVYGNEITLTAKDSIGSSENPLVIEEGTNKRKTSAEQSLHLLMGEADDSAIVVDENGNMTVALRSDWNREWDESEGTQLKAKAEEGSIYLTERTGDIGAGEDGEITAANGEIEIHIPDGDLASADNRMNVTVGEGEEMTVTGKGSVNLDVNGDLTLNLDTTKAHVEITTNDGNDPENPAQGDITVNNQNTKTLTGSADSNGSVTLNNQGDIGTDEAAFQIMTDAENGGTLTVTAKNANIEQKGNNDLTAAEVTTTGSTTLTTGGTLTIGQINAGGDVNLTAGGDVTDTGDSTLSETIDRIAEAEHALAEAENRLAAAETEEEKEAAQRAYDNAAAAVENAKAAAETLEKVKELRQAEENAEAAAEDAAKKAEETRTAAEEAAAKAAEAQEAYNRIKDDPEVSDEAKAEALAAAEKAQENAETAQAEAEAAQAKAEKAEQDVQQAKAAAAAEEYVLGAHEQLADAYDEVAEVLNDKHATADKIEAAEQKLATAQQALTEAEQIQALVNSDKATAEEKQAAEAVLERLEKAAEAKEAAEQILSDENATEAEKAQAEADVQLANDALAAAKQYLNELTDPARDDLAAAQAAAQAADDAAQKALDKANDDYDEAAEKAGQAADRLTKAQGDASGAADTVSQKQKDVDNANTAVEKAKEDLKKAQDAQSALPDNATDQQKAEAAQAVETAKTELKQKQDDLATAKTELAEAQKAQTQADNELKAAEKADKQAQDKLQKAEEAKKAAEAKKNDTADALRDANKAVEASDAVVAAAEALAKATAANADNQSDREKAQAELEAAEADQNRVTELAGELNDPVTGKDVTDAALAAAQDAYDAAYEAYLEATADKDPNSVTGSNEEQEALKTLDEKLEALKEAEAAAEANNAKLEELKELTGADNTADALAAAADKVTEAQNKVNSVAGETPVNRDDLAEDKTGTGAVRATGKKSDDAPVTAGGNVNIVSGGSVNGADGTGLAISTDGVVNVDAEDDVKLRSDDDLTLGSVSGSNTDIAATGNLTGTGDTPNVAGSDVTLDAISLNGKEADIGTDSKPLTTDADTMSLSGTNANVSNEGNLELGNVRTDDDANITTNGNLSQQDGSSVTGDNVTLDASGNVELGDINSENLDVTAGNNITEKDDSAITTGNLDLNAGNDIDLHNTTADQINAQAGNDVTLTDTTAGSMTVNAGNDVTLGETTTQTADITAGGTVGQTSGSVLNADTLTVQAGGNIGSDDKPLTIRTNEITAGGANVYLNNLSDSLMVHNITGEVVKIKTAGDINTYSDGLIKAKELWIHAMGHIGRPDAKMRVHVMRKLELISDAGRPWYINLFWPTLTDKATGVSVHGHFDILAGLTVIATAEFAKELYPEEAEELLKDIAAEDVFNFTGGCTKDLLDLLSEKLDDGTGACKLLWKLIAEGRTLYDFVLKITHPACDSKIILTVPLAGLDPDYNGELEGRTVYVLITVRGSLICVKTTVEDGTVKAVLDGLGISRKYAGYTQVIILSEEEFDRAYGEGLIPDESLRDADGNELQTTEQASAEEATDA